MQTLHTEFIDKIIEITELSDKINKSNNHKILEMIKEHIVEIEKRYNDKDDHWAIEIADLIVLCYELLLLENMEIDEVFNRCLPRFDVKLKKLADNVI